ncbi:hypothetical protein [Streptomyces sp. NPDC048172]|uniref:hypothetical protein n=1 Tax=Streptomyces sp. NPDC048172 TaxID=3365505 RepID=UPI00371B6FF9
MGGSVRRGRGKAAAPSLRYAREPGPRAGSGEKKGRDRKDTVFGCLIFLAVAAVIVLLALTDMWWGEDTWRWAADSWPGGAYSFAAFLGALLPCAVALFGLALARGGRGGWKKSWRERPVRPLLGGLGAAGSAVVLFGLTVLIFDAQDNGRSRRGSDGPPSWVYAHFPWLWALGLAVTLVVGAVLIAVAVAVGSKRDSGAATP